MKLQTSIINFKQNGYIEITTVIKSVNDATIEDDNVIESPA